MPPFERILFPVDFSERSPAAAPFVLSMAQRHKSQVVLLHALQAPPPQYLGVNTVYPEIFDFKDISTTLRARLAEFAEAQLPKLDVACVVDMGDPAAVITTYAESENIGLIMMPTHGYGAFRRLLLGSVTAKVLHDSKVPVWTDAHAPEPSHRAHPAPRRVICTVDLKPHSRAVLEFAADVAAETDATLELVHMPPEGHGDASKLEMKLHELLADVCCNRKVRLYENEGGAEVEVVTDGGSVADKVRDLAVRRRADLVVIGRSFTHRGIVSLQPTSYAIVREAPCPVLSV